MDKDHDTRLSKRLSYLLRHGAVREGLQIKCDGFVRVEEILKKKLRGYSQKDIERVVANDEKQRYTLAENNGILEIRANQGHSLREICDLPLKLIKEDPDFDIVHGTYLEHWPKIRTEGLSRMKRNHIHFAKGLNFVCGLRKSAELYIYIDFKKAREAGLTFLESENGIVLCSGNARGIIETRYFSKVTTRNCESLLEESLNSSCSQ